MHPAGLMQTPVKTGMSLYLLHLFAGSCHALCSFQKETAQQEINPAGAVACACIAEGIERASFGFALISVC
jgi:hypothetical protein